MNPRLSRAVVVVMAVGALTLSAGFFLQGAPLTSGSPSGPAEAFMLPFSVKFLAMSAGSLPVALRVYAIAAGLAAMLALALALRPRQIPAALGLGRALAGLALFAAYFVLARHVALFASSPPLLGVLDYVGMGALALGLAAWLEVALTYPQAIDAEAYVAFTRKMSMQTRLGKLGAQAAAASRTYARADSVSSSVLLWLLRAARTPWWPLGLAVAGGGLVAFSRIFGGGLALFVAGWTMTFIVAYLTAALTFGALEWQYRTGNAEDRARIAWLFLGLVVFFWLWSCLLAGSMLWLLFGGGEKAAPFFAAGMTLALPAGAIVLVVLLGCSIFFFGAIDPRMAIRKTSLYGVATLLLAVALAAAQSSAVHEVVTRVGLPGNAGNLLAGAMVALVFAPMRKRIEVGVERAVERVLPASALAEAQRETVTVAFVDLCGYTELSATNEPAALTLASLLHKESRRLAERHGGRLVKTIGDAVLLSFPDPGEAVLACTELREKFAAAAGTLGLPVLPLHFGLHAGEVVRGGDGDIFGSTVNLASRLQGQARPGEIVVSASVASRVEQGGFSLQSLGEKLFKNVPAPVSCFLVA